MKKGKLVRATAIFFALMLCFTILSRAADQLNVAVVQTERPQNRMIEHSVKAAGRIVQNQEMAVTTLPDQRVTAIYVREGQRVEKGDLLFEIDLTLLEEQILNQEQEMEKQELQAEDAKSQKEVSAQQRANAQAQAAEQYSLSTRQAGVQLSRAKQQLDQAKEKLKKFRESLKSGKAGNSGGSATGGPDVEEVLLQALEDKTNAYVAAQGELRTLEWEIENAVYTAKQEAANRTSAALEGGSSGATFEAESRVFTGTADTWPEADAGEEEILPEAIDVSEFPEIGQTNVNSAGALGESVGDIDSGIEIEDVSIGGTDSRASGVENENVTAPDLDIGDMIVDDIPKQTVPQTPTPAELAQIEQTVRADYSGKLEAARKKVSDAQDEKEAAETALVQYQQEQLAADSSGQTQTAKQLAADVQAAQQAYEDAALAANEAAVTSGRAVATANIADPSNSSDRINEITGEQMELALEKLKGLKKAKGKVRAGADGLVTKINIMTGEKTTDTTALLMADISKGYRFTADITKEQQKYIGTGDLVRLISGDGKQKLEDLPVESVAADENNEGVYHVTVQIPKDTFEPGMNVNLDFVRKSETYPVTVPLSALHLDAKQQPYVLAVEDYDSIMGTEQRARRLSVTVLEQNESYAALAEGVIGSGQEIIVQSDKALDSGSRVRVG